MCKFIMDCTISITMMLTKTTTTYKITTFILPKDPSSLSHESKLWSHYHKENCQLCTNNVQTIKPPNPMLTQPILKSCLYESQGWKNNSFVFHGSHMIWTTTNFFIFMNSLTWIETRYYWTTFFETWTKDLISWAILWTIGH